MFIERTTAIEICLMNFKYGSGFAMAVMRGLVISGLFAADTLNKFAGKLVGRMCGDVQFVIFFKKW